MTNDKAPGVQIAYISVGSNLGDRMGNCRRAVSRLTEPAHTNLSAISEFYQTAPVEYEEQGWFVNAVIRVSTCLAPHELLDTLLAVEADLGRNREGVPRFGPRTIDLDLIFYGGQQIESRTLVLPHPRMHKRRFVLEPICDIEPELLHPVCRKTMRQLLDDPKIQGQELVKYCNNKI